MDDPVAKIKCTHCDEELHIRHTIHGEDDNWWFSIVTPFGGGGAVLVDKDALELFLLDALVAVRSSEKEK